MTGTIHLTTGVLAITSSPSNDGLVITGPGRDVLAVSGDGASRVFDITTNGPVSISGLMITNGLDHTTGGGGINNSGGANLTLTDAAVTDSESDNGSGGGGIRMGSSSPLTLIRSVVSGNTSAASGGGVRVPSYGSGLTTIVDSTISGNHGSYGGGLAGGGLLTMSGSTVSGNTADIDGGGIQFSAKYNAEVTDSVISGNTSPRSGGMLLSVVSYVYSSVAIRDTTISGNHGARGAGLQVGGALRGNRLTLDRTTISGNEGGPGSFGGGILFEKYLFGDIEVRDSTISGNTATVGAGVSVGSDSHAPLLTKYNGLESRHVGTLTMANSTIAANRADTHGGGLYLSDYDSQDQPPVRKSATVGLRSTVVGDNTAAGAAEDLDRIDTSTSGGFDAAFALIEQPGDAPVTRRATIVARTHSSARWPTMAARPGRCSRRGRAP